MQRRFDIIIHKITEDIRSSDDDSRAKISHLEKYLLLNPHTQIVDPLDSVEKVISRSRVCNILDSIIKRQLSRTGKCDFNQPSYVVVDNVSIIEEVVSRASIKFPVICKPIEACGTPNSHSMVVIMLLFCFNV